MAKKTESIMLIVVVLAAGVLLGSGQAWAQCASPCETVRIYSDEATGYEALKTVWDPCTCKLVAVYFCDPEEPSYHDDDGTCISDWVELDFKPAYICDGPPEPSTDYANCTRMNAGPGSSGLILRDWNVCWGGWCGY